MPANYTLVWALVNIHSDLHQIGCNHRRYPSSGNQRRVVDHTYLKTEPKRKCLLCWPGPVSSTAVHGHASVPFANTPLISQLSAGWNHGTTTNSMTFLMSLDRYMQGQTRGLRLSTLRSGPLRHCGYFAIKSSLSGSLNPSKTFRSDLILAQ
jgi:hypothetical protein